MALNAYLKFGDIKGESLDDKHKDEIDVLSFSWGVTQPGSAGGGGKVSMQDFHFVLKVDKSSPLLYKVCATGEHIREATLTVRKAGKGQQDYLKYKFEDILITSFVPATKADLTGIIGEDTLQTNQGVPGAIATVSPMASDAIASMGTSLRPRKVGHSVLGADGKWIEFDFDFAPGEIIP